MQKVKIILNSTSPARRALLQRLQIPFTMGIPDVDETPKAGETITELVKRLAIKKAKANSEQYHPALIIGCDQLLFCDGQIIGKPENHEGAVKQLKLASGRTMRSYTALALYNTRTKDCQVVVEPFNIIMRELTDEIIENYLNKEKPYHCAGSLKAEGLGIAMIAKMQGEDPNALSGLPLIKLVDLLSQAGYQVI